MTVEKIPIKNRGDWLALRSQDFTASDVGAAFGCHPYRTLLAVYSDKRGEGVPRGDNAAMRRGRLLQPSVAEGVREERPDWRIIPAEHYYRDPDLRLGATPDFHIERAGETGVMETKTVDPQVFERDWTEDRPPLCWLLQVLTQAMLTGASFCVVAALIMTRSLPLKIYEFERHPGAEARIRAKAIDFWAMVKSETPPMADYSRDGEAIAALFPRPTQPMIDLSDDNRIRELLERRAELAGELGERNDEKDAIDAEIKHKLGTAEGATLPGWRVSWKLQHRAEKLMPAASFRTLRITDLRAKEAMP